MPDDTPTPPQTSLILYQTEDGRTRIQCRFENETIWLTQIEMAELFQTTVPNINLHLKAIYAESELREVATIKPYLIVRIEGFDGDLLPGRDRRAVRPIADSARRAVAPYLHLRCDGRSRKIAPELPGYGLGFALGSPVGGGA